MIGQTNSAVRPVSERQLAHHPIARQWKAHTELRCKIQSRNAELVSLVLGRDSEAEESLDRTSGEYLPAPGKRQSPVRVGHHAPIRRVCVVKDLSPAETKEPELVAALAPVQGNR